jgi:hypothetical protein
MTSSNEHTHNDKSWLGDEVLDTPHSHIPMCHVAFYTMVLRRVYPLLGNGSVNTFPQHTHTQQ